MEQQMDQLFGSGTQPPAIRSVARGTFPPINVGAARDGITRKQADHTADSL